jgi:hypothetical protein
MTGSVRGLGRIHEDVRIIKGKHEEETVCVNVSMYGKSCVTCDLVRGAVMLPVSMETVSCCEAILITGRLMFESD